MRVIPRFNHSRNLWSRQPVNQSHEDFSKSGLVSDANTPTARAATTVLPCDITTIDIDKLNTNFVDYRSVHAFWTNTVRSRNNCLYIITSPTPPLKKSVVVVRDGFCPDYALQPETLLFARDPEEVFETIGALRPGSSTLMALQLRHV